MRGGGCGRNDDTAHTVCLENHTYPSKTEMEPEYVFSYAENQPEDYPTTLGAKYFAELVEERTNGRIRILVQPVGVLGSENKVIKQMQYGGIDDFIL